MNTQTISNDKQITVEDLMPFPLEELENLITNMCEALEKNIHEIIGYAQVATETRAQREKVMGLEEQFKRTWEEMKVAVEALIARVVASEKNEQEWSKLAQMLREGMTLLQAVPMDVDLTWEWVPKRNALVARTAALLKRSPLQEFIDQLTESNPDALFQLFQDVTSRLASQVTPGEEASFAPSFN